MTPFDEQMLQKASEEKYNALGIWLQLSFAKMLRHHILMRLFFKINLQDFDVGSVSSYQPRTHWLEKDLTTLDK